MGDFALFTIYLFYGAVFFAIGITILTRLKTFTTLGITGLFWLLALFAFSHCLHEWLELYLLTEQALLEQQEYQNQLRQLSLFLLLISFLVLFFYGINLHSILNRKSWPYLSLLMVLMGILFLHVNLNLSGPPPFDEVDISIRWFFAVPATLLTGSAFILYARRLHTLSVKGANSFTGAGVSFLIYGFFTGLVPSTTVIMMMPVQFWRGLSAFIILLFIVKALDHFLAQRDIIISEQLLQAAHLEKLGTLGRLAAGIAHEINNPLANVSLQLELLQKEGAANGLAEKNRRRLAIIERNVEKSANIAGELLSLVGRRDEPTTLQPVNLNGPLNAAWASLSHRSPPYSLHNHLPPGLTIQGLPLRLEQLFRNLFDNAMDAMPQGGKIEVYGHQMADKIVISIFDQGGGIKREHQGRVMEPFFTTKTVGKGTGLGLSICHAVMIQHDGAIEVAPRRDGSGTMVHLVFRQPNRSGMEG